MTLVRSSRPKSKYQYINVFKVYEAQDPNPGANLVIETSVLNTANITGTRKVKNFTVEICYKADGLDAIEAPIFWCLAYVPQGFQAALSVCQQNNLVPFLNNPSYIISSGCIGPLSQDSQKYYTPLARNVNQGDDIKFIFFAHQGQNVDRTISLNCSYSISY